MWPLTGKCGGSVGGGGSLGLGGDAMFGSCGGGGGCCGLGGVATWYLSAVPDGELFCSRRLGTQLP